jgi:hypothetical protein
MASSLDGLHGRIAIANYQHDLYARASYTDEAGASESRSCSVRRQLRDRAEAEHGSPALQACVVRLPADEAKAQSAFVELDRRLDVVDEELDAEAHREKGSVLSGDDHATAWA